MSLITQKRKILTASRLWCDEFALALVTFKAWSPLESYFGKIICYMCDELKSQLVTSYMLKNQNVIARCDE